MQDTGGPWTELSRARSFLRMLVGQEQPHKESFGAISVPELGAWLIAQGVGPIAHSRFKDEWPELAGRLRADAYSAAIEYSLHLERLERIHKEFSKVGIPMVLLKGAALSLAVYGEPSWRPMSDIDLWVQDEQMPAAVAAMQAAGFMARASGERPPALQKLMDGEIQFTESHGGLVELHWSPYSGWWLQGVASVDNKAVWERIEPVKPLPERHSEGLFEPAAAPAEQFFQLACEDGIIQLAVHVSVGHKFGIWPMRSLLDIFLLITKRDVDWSVLVERSRSWKLETVVWYVLGLVNAFFELEEVKPVMYSLQPSWMRQRLLRPVMPAEQLIADSDLRERFSRFPLLLLLVDHPFDMVRLGARMVWPDSAWLEARYGQARAKRLRHMWRVIRYRQI